MSAFKYEWHKKLIESGLPHATIVVGLAVWDDTTGTGQRAFPGERRLAERLGISERRVRGHLCVLRHHGWLVRTRRGSTAGRRSFADEYKLAAPDHRTETSGGVGADHRTPVTDHRTVVTGPPDSTVRPSDPAPDHVHHHSAASAAAPRKRADADDADPDRYNPDRHDPMEWLDELCFGFDAGEEPMAASMLDRGYHPHAVYNTILERRGIGRPA